MQIKGGVLVVLYLSALIVSGGCDGASANRGDDFDNLAVLGAMSMGASFLYGLYLAITARRRTERGVLGFGLAMVVIPVTATILAAIGGTCASIAKGGAGVIGVVVWIGWMFSSC